MKTKEQIISEINERLAEEFEVEQSTIVPEANIYETLELDSISLIDLVGIIHSDYGIKIEKEELPAIRTFDALYEYILSRQK